MLIIVVTFLLASMSLLHAQYDWRALHGPYGNTNFKILGMDSSRNIWGATYHQLFRSSNSGVTWLPGGIDDTRIRGLTVSADGTIAAVADSGSVFLMKKGSTAWVRTKSRALPSGNEALLITGGGTFLCYGCLLESASCHITRSTNSGVSWNLVQTFSFGNGNFYRFDSVLFLVEYRHLFRSVDDGVTWNHVKGLLVGSNPIREADGVLRILADQGISQEFFSSDLGVTWDSIPSHAYGSVLIDEGGGSLVVLSPVSAYRSGDHGAVWKRVGTYVENVSSGIRCPEGSLLMGTTTGPFRSSDGGQNWSQVINYITSPDLDAVMIADNGNIILGAILGGVFTSSDQGATWSQFVDNDSDAVANRPGQYRMIGPFTKSPNGYIHAASRVGIYRWTDHGITWQRRTRDDINSIVAGDSGQVLASVHDGKYYRRSTDYGESWDSLTTDGKILGTVLHNRILHCFYAPITKASSAKSGYYQSTDGGRGWTYQITSGDLSEIILYCDQFQGRLFRVLSPPNSSSTLWFSSDNGASWHQLGSFPAAYPPSSLRREEFIWRPCPTGNCSASPSTAPNACSNTSRLTASPSQRWRSIQQVHYLVSAPTAEHTGQQSRSFKKALGSDRSHSSAWSGPQSRARSSAGAPARISDICVHDNAYRSPWTDSSQLLIFGCRFGERYSSLPRWALSRVLSGGVEFYQSKTSC